MSTTVTSIVHTNIGMRMKVMPGARILTMVTKKVEAAQHGRDAEDEQADVPEVDVACRASK